jgi:uncharacterized UBP type Zn finger protein
LLDIFAQLIQEDPRICKAITMSTQTLIRCQNCYFETISNERFEILQINLTEKNIDLFSLIKSFFQHEVIEYKCDCKSQFADSYSRPTLLPPTLIVCLKRFTSSCKKIDTKIEIPKILNLKVNRVEFKYELRAVVQHNGKSLESGHFVTDLLVEKNWMRMNDAKKESIQEEAVFSCAAYKPYMFFFEYVPHSEVLPQMDWQASFVSNYVANFRKTYSDYLLYCYSNDIVPLSPLQFYENIMSGLTSNNQLIQEVTNDRRLMQ